MSNPKKHKKHLRQIALKHLEDMAAGAYVWSSMAEKNKDIEMLERLASALLGYLREFHNVEPEKAVERIFKLMKTNEKTEEPQGTR